MSKRHISNRVLNFGFPFFLCALVAACAVAARVSTWEAPNRFGQEEVFSGAMQAGIEQGMQLIASDRTSGTISFGRRYGAKQMVLNVRLRNLGDSVQVGTTSAFSGGFPIAGLHEETIRNFHVFLFHNLGITDGAERVIDLKLLE